MARDLELPISAPGANQTARDITGVARKVDNLGDEAAQAARKVGKLNDEMAETDRRLKQLAQTYAETGERTILKMMRQERGLLAEQRRALATLVPKSPPSPAGGGGGGAGLFGQALGSPMIPAAVGAGVLASPAIGAAVNAAILAGIGSAGIGAGIASAIRQDDTVKKEFRLLGREFVGVFDEMGEPFIQPMRGAARFLRGELRGLAGDWTKTIGGLADVVEPLTKGIAGLFKNASPGFLKALEASEPVIQVLADKLPGLGEDISTMMESFASGGEGAAEGMAFLLDVIGDLAVVTGETVEHLSKMFDKMTDFADEGGVFAGQLFGWWTPFLVGADEAQSKIKSGSDGFDEIGDAAKDAEVDVKGLHRAFTDLIGEFMTLDELEIRVAEGFDALRESVDRHGASMNINTEAGRSNRQALLDQIDALADQRQANIDSGMSVSRANELYDQQRRELVKLATQLGISRVELEKLLGKYNLIQSKTVTLGVVIKYSSTGNPPPASRLGTVEFFGGGGPITGPGPKGVDSRLIVGAPGEYVLNTNMVDQLGGVQALEQLRRGGGSAYAGAASMGGGGGGGGTRTLQPIQLILDGRVVHESLVDLAVRRGQTPSQLWPDAR